MLPSCPARIALLGEPPPPSSTAPPPQVTSTSPSEARITISSTSLTALRSLAPAFNSIEIPFLRVRPGGSARVSPTGKQFRRHSTLIRPPPAPIGGGNRRFDPRSVGSTG